MPDPPEAYLPGDRRRALAAGRSLPERTVGAALFADVSGFTRLTEALALEVGAHRGAEELTGHLNRVFHAVIEQVHRYGGEVIYFAGDAITCWFDGDDGARVAAAAMAVQAAMAGVGRIATPSGAEVTLAVKVAIGVGAVRRFVVGDPALQLLDVLAGRVVDELAEAETMAQAGEIVLAPSAVAALAGRAVTSERVPAGDGGTVTRLDALAVGVAPTPPPVEVPLAADLVRPWLLPAVYERLARGEATLLAELRPAYPVFVRFGTIDFDEDPDAAAKLDGFVVRAQAVFARYGGNLLQLVLGDKGAYLYAVFGSPNAHEDDALRAASAALDLLGLTAETAVTQLQIGVTSGRLRSGTYGHAMRRTFVCLGDAVNLAARLMALAPAGAVYLTDEVRAAAGERLRCDAVGDVTVKGRVEPVGVHSLRALGPRPRQRALRFPLPLVGRAAELTAVEGALVDALAGRGRVVAMAAEAGRGKSRLLAEVLRSIRARGLSVAVGEASSIGSSGAYTVWREVWTTLLGLDEDEPDDVSRRRVVAQLDALSPGRARRAPLLGPVLGIDLPDNDLTAAFSAQLRKSSRHALLVELLRDRARSQPLVLVLDDCHWIDPLSLDLLQDVARAVAALPVLLLLTYRPTAEPWAGLGLGALAHATELLLDELDADGARAVVEAKLRQVFGPDVAPAPGLVDTIVARGQGNPFYLEELVSYLRSRGLDPTDPGVASGVELPDSLHRVVLGRLDVLPTAPFDVLKVASVVGRAFDAATVQGTHGDLGDAAAVEEHLAVARDADLAVPDQAEDHSWLFRHQVTRDVVYENLPFATRSLLHTRVGLHLENRGPEVVERNLDLLAAHFGLGDDPDRRRHYLVRAGEAAQASYANEAAAGYFRRALAELAPRDRPPVRRRLGKVLEVLGRWSEAEAAFGEALAEARAVGDDAGAAWARTDLAEVLRKQGRFDAAAAELDGAGHVFEAQGGDAGLGLVLHLRGTLASQQGRYDEATAAYEASLTIRRRLGDRAAVGSLLANLAVVAESVGDIERARELAERALAEREGVGDRWAIAVSSNNVGLVALLQQDLEAARASFERALALAGEVGDRWVAAVVHHNLGNAQRDLGDHAAAARELAAALATYADHDDRWSIALLVEDAALLVAAAGRWEDAISLVAAADAARDALAAARPPSVAAALERALEPAGAALSADERADAASRGARMDAGSVRILLDALCDP